MGQCQTWGIGTDRPERPHTMDLSNAPKSTLVPRKRIRGAVCTYRLPHSGMYKVVNEHRKAAGIAPLPFVLTKVRFTSSIPPVENIFSPAPQNSDMSDAADRFQPVATLSQSGAADGGSLHPVAQLSGVRTITFGPSFSAPAQETATYPDTLVGIMHPRDTASVTALEKLVTSRAVIDKPASATPQNAPPEVMLALSA